MQLHDFDLFLFSCLFLFGCLLLNVSNGLHLLLLTELIWISLYSSVTILSFIFNDTNLLSLTFFFLLFSAVELSIGFLLMIMANFFFNFLITWFNNINEPQFLFRSYYRLNLQKFLFFK